MVGAVQPSEKSASIVAFCYGAPMARRSLTGLERRKGYNPCARKH